jgi:hypothetical protein
MGALDIRYDAHVVVIELAGRHLRHASNATATVHVTSRSPQQLRAIEKKTALKATTRAVSDALTLLDRG